MAMQHSAAQSFFRIPKILLRDERYRALPAEARFLYGMLLDRTGLSEKNGWRDECGQLYIYFSIRACAEALGCGETKAKHLFAQLERAGLLRRVRRGQGLPRRLYLCDPESAAIPPQAAAQDCAAERDLTQTGAAPTDRRGEIRPTCGAESDRLVGRNPPTNKTEKNKTECHKTLSSINVTDVTDAVKQQLDFQELTARYPAKRTRLEELLSLITDIRRFPTGCTRINAVPLPTAQVAARFEMLRGEHLLYVLDSMDESAGDIRNIRAYLLTALYNAPNTMDSYYSAQVNRDMGAMRPSAAAWPRTP